MSCERGFVRKNKEKTIIMNKSSMYIYAQGGADAAEPAPIMMAEEDAVCIYIYIYIYIYTYTYICIYLYMCTQLFVDTVYTYIHTGGCSEDRFYTPPPRGGGV